MIVGVDKRGAHIYTVIDGNVAYREETGYAAIGSGAQYANEQFMLTGHTKFKSFARTRTLVYLAKKRAEVNPFVGRETFMFIIDQSMDGISRRLEQEEIDRELEPVYQGYRDCERRLLESLG